MVSFPQAQVNEWPYDLRIQGPIEPSEIDSHSVGLISQQSLYMNTIISTDSLWLSHDNMAYRLRQAAYYRLEKNDLFQSQKQYFDLSGAALKKKWLLPWASMGIDWTPLLLLNSSKVNHALSGSLDIGPVIQSNLLSLPIALRGGFAGKLQSDSFSINNFHNPLSGNSQRDKGVYGSFDIGDANVPLFSLPLFFKVKGYGRSQETSKLFTAIGSALFCRDLSSGDTLSLLYADSLINGSGAVLGDEGAQGKSFFMDIPQSIIRSYQAKGGIQGKYRWHLQPAFFYSFARRSTQYPAGKSQSNTYNQLSDRQNTVRSINAMMRSDSSSSVYYCGGLRIDLEKEEKLFKSAIIMNRMIDPSNSDTLKVKLNDYDGYRAMMKHVLSLRTKNGACAEYSFTISRYLKTYPNFYLDESLKKVESNEDKDWIIQNHHLDLTPISGAKGKITITGEYSTNLSYNLKEEKSASNSMDYFYLIGGNSFYFLSEKLKVEASASADVKRTTYIFPEKYLKMGLLPPSYSREITAQGALTWIQNKKNTLRTEWREHYEDDGYWFDKESINLNIPSYDSVKAAFKPYYGKERTQWRHSLSVKDSIAINRYLLLTTGSSLEYIYQKKFNDLLGGYSTDASQTRYVIVPFITMESPINKNLSLKARIKRNIDTVKDDYWDFTFFLAVKF
jgi:hypothetical protein